MSVTIPPQVLQLLGSCSADTIWSLVISVVASVLGLLLVLPRQHPLWPNQPGRKVVPSWYLGTKTVFLPLRLLEPSMILTEKASFSGFPTIWFSIQ
jgi:hypothetical protein